MKLKFLFVATAIVTCIHSVAAEIGLVGACRNKTIQTVTDFSPEQYLGRWYEIGRSKSFAFEDGCERSVAEYTLLPNNPPGETMIRVNNSCFKRGHWTNAIGKGKWQPPNGNFLVSFFGPFEAPYDVVHLDPGYRTALVVSCSEFGGSNLWILHRNPNMERSVAENLVGIFQRLGFVTRDFELNSVIP